MRHSVSLSFSFPSAKAADVVAQTLAPEMAVGMPKAAVSVSTVHETLVLSIEASDLSTLRAACNSYLRWVQTAVSVQQLV